MDACHSGDAVPSQLETGRTSSAKVGFQEWRQLLSRSQTPQGPSHSKTATWCHLGHDYTGLSSRSLGTDALQDRAWLGHPTTSPISCISCAGVDYFPLPLRLRPHLQADFVSARGVLLPVASTIAGKRHMLRSRFKWVSFKARFGSQIYIYIYIFLNTYGVCMDYCRVTIIIIYKLYNHNIGIYWP